MIRLMQFPAAFGARCPSPFCVKAEILLKMSGQPYAVEFVADPRKGPKGKLPAIEDDGRVIGDSELIRRHLEEAYGVDFDAGLSSEEQARGHAFARAIEERLYWVIVYSRWFEPENWARVRHAFFGGMPPVLRDVIATFMHRKTRGYLHGQGLGRHAREDIYRFGAADLRAIAAELGNRPFFLGPRPTGADATVFAFLDAILDPPFPSPLKEECERHENLRAYCVRMAERYFA